MSRDREVIDRFKFAVLVKSHRERKLWSQDDLAREIGVTTRTISSVENAKHSANLKTVRKIVRALGLTPKQIPWLEEDESADSSRKN